jgi:hypothetical protein
MAGKGTRTSDSMEEFLTGLLQEVAFAMTIPNADLGYLQKLQGALLGKIRAPLDQYLASQGAPPLGAQQMGPQGGGGGRGQGQGPAGQVPAGVSPGGAQSVPQMGDELRRMLTQGAGLNAR